ncbi:MAG TPA: hypothetical protein VII92_20780 [Anaerolineae bacterium]
MGLSVIGILTGIMQWSVLKEQGYKTLGWIPATALSWGAGLPLGLALSEVLNTIINFRSIAGWLMLGAWIGIVFGVAQWFVLRQQVRQSHWLMVADVVGWTVALPLSVLATGLAEDPIFTIIYALVGTIVSTIITGLALMWLLRHPTQQPDQSTPSVPSV